MWGHPRPWPKTVKPQLLQRNFCKPATSTPGEFIFSTSMQSDAPSSGLNVWPELMLEALMLVKYNRNVWHCLTLYSVRITRKRVAQVTRNASSSAMAERLRGLSHFKGWVTLRPNIRLPVCVSRQWPSDRLPVNNCWYQKTKVIVLSCGITVSAVHCLVLSQSTRVPDGQKNRRTQLRLPRPP